MPIADTSQSSLAYVVETTEGQTPATPTLTDLRFSSETLGFNITNVQSAEISSSRGVRDLVQTEGSADGDVSFEMSYAAFDPFIEAALHRDFSATVDVSGSVIGSDYTILLDDPVPGQATIRDDDSNAQFNDIVPGQYVLLTGFNAANNGLHRVAAMGTEDTIIIEQASGMVAETVSASGSSRIRAGWSRDGRIAKSFTLEKGFNDVNEYYGFTGMRVNTWNMSLATGAIATGSFSFLGREFTPTRSTTLSDGGTINPASLHRVMNTVTNISDVRENSMEVGSPNFVQSLDFTLENNLRQQRAIGQGIGAVGVGTGTVNVTGNMTVYFGDDTILNRYLSGAETNIRYTMSDAAGNMYVFDFPRVQFTTATVNITGQNADVVATVGWQALEHTTNGYTMAVNRFAA